MKIETASGLTGTLIAYEVLDLSRDEGFAIVLRQGLDEDHAYSTHRIYESAVRPGALIAEAGHYDLSYDEAVRDFERRCGR